MSAASLKGNGVTGSADLVGKVALVTGGTRGLGRRMVSALAASGADLVVTSRDEAACHEVAGQLSKESGRRAFPGPVTSAGGMR